MRCFSSDLLGRCFSSIRGHRLFGHASMRSSCALVVGLPASPFLFVANRCSKRSLFSSIDVSCAMQGAHAAELKDGGVEVEQALGTGLTYDLVSSRNAFAQSVRELMGEVVGEAAGSLASFEESEAPSRGLFSFRRARREGVLP